MNINYVVHRNFSRLIVSAFDWRVPWNKMDILKAVHIYNYDYTYNRLWSYVYYNS